MATANETLHDEAVNYAIQLHRYSNGQVRKIIALLNRADAQLTAELDAAIARNAPQATIDHIDVVLQQVRAINAEAYRQVGATLTAHLAEFTAYTVGKELGIIRLALPGGARAVVDLQGVSPAQVNAAAMARPFQGRLLREWMADLETARAAKIRDAVRIGIVNGNTTEQIVRTIRGTRANGYADGLLERPRADLETIVRSAISHTAAYAREQVVQANADIVRALAWVAVLDQKTTQQCRVRDGHTYSTDKHKPLDGGPPWGAGPGQLHFNCRSVSVPVLKSWRELGLKDPSPATRASMDGAVPAEMNYAEWLAKQPMERVEEILGPIRARLYKKGGLKLAQFSNDKGTLYTLDELRKLDAAAFAKAGLS